MNDVQILTESGRTKPPAILKQEKVASLRRWAKNRCLSADYARLQR